MQKFSALAASNPVRKTSFIFKAHLQLNFPVIPNFIVFNNLLIGSPVVIAEAFYTYFFSAFINDHLLHSKIHPMLASVRLFPVSFDIADVTTVTTYAKPSHRSELAGIQQSRIVPLVQILPFSF